MSGAPAKKTTAKRTAAKKTTSARASDQQVVFLVGPSHGGKDGDRRSVSPEQAKSLVDRGLARYPANHTDAD